MSIIIYLANTLTFNLPRNKRFNKICVDNDFPLLAGCVLHVWALNNGKNLRQIKGLVPTDGVQKHSMLDIMKLISKKNEYLNL